MHKTINPAVEGNTVLVLGGTGKTGRRIVGQLRDKGLPVRIGSRSANPGFDWYDQSTWAKVIEDVSTVYISFYPDLAVPGAPEAIQAFTDLAVNSGIKKIVLLSGRGEEEAQRCEQIVQNSGVKWTIVRASWFAQNFSEAFMRDLILSGTLALPAGDVKEPFIDADDIADVAVAALSEEGHEAQLYEITGPRLMTFTEAVDEISKGAGIEVDYIQIPAQVFSDEMAAQGVPSEYIDLVNYLFTTVLDGRNSYICDGVQRALGREPRDFSEYVKIAASEGAWVIEEEASD